MPDSASEFCIRKSYKFKHLGLMFAVGMPIAGRPPHRSVQAEFPHTAPTSGV
jgi:hypothetical protein